MKRVYRFLCMAIVAICMLGVAAVVAACADKSTPSQPKEYTITLKLNEEQVWDSFTGKKGAKVEFEKGEPSRPNNNFKGWSLTPDGEVVELPTVMPENGGTYYAVFSRYYNITLRAGSGTLDGETRIRAEVGQNIYSLVKDISPTAPGNSAFDGWYYGNKKIDAESTDVMPTAAITLDAKYTVPYTINIFKQTDYKSDNYDKVADDTVTGVGFIGSSPRDSLYPVYTGYEFFEEKSGATADFVLDAAGDNVFNAYYNIQAYRLVFNPNTPKNETVNGSMGTAEWGYDIENSLPDCEYTINGYRFVYWSTKEDGSDRLDVGKEYKITDNTTLYAIWLRGCADISGRSSDYIYLIDDGKGNTVACLERYYLDDIIGTYDPVTRVAVFKDGNNTEILRGKLDPDSYSFAYLSSQAYVRHNLSNSQSSFGDGSIDETETLTLAEDGAATYVKGANNVIGTYAFDSAEQSIRFIPNGNDGEPFYFRLTQFRSAEGEMIDVFEVRSEAEVGEWCRLTDDYVLGSDYVDTNFVIEFNGYGEAVMHATSEVQETTVDYGGYYRYSATSTAEKPEIYTLFITSYGDQSNRITLVDRTKTAAADAEYKRFYKECVVATTAYAKPDGDAALDIATADSITLDGYGLYADSAVYKVGEQSTSGSYVLNWSNRTLEFKPAQNGNSVTYFVDTVTVGEGDDAKTYLVYEPIQSGKSELNKLWAISGLENNFNPGYAYGFRFFNDNEAVLYMVMPDINQTFNVLNVSLQPVFSGRYEPTEESGEYLFTAEIPAEAANLIAYYYYQLFKQAINISNFDDFKFKFTSSTEGEVTAIGDGINGVELVDDGATYVTDGYGKAKVTNSSGIVTATRDYVYSAALGLPCVTLTWEEDGTDVGGKPIKVSKSKLYTLIDGEYRENLETYGKYNTQYSSQIGDTYFVLITYADDYAVLAYQSNRVLIMYSWGGVTWTDSGKNFGSYAEHGAIAGADRTYYDLYGDFNFGFKDEKLSNGDTATRFFIYETPASEVVDGKYVVNGKDGATLTVDLNKCEAEYSVPAAEGGKTTISGEFKLREDVLTIVYTQDAEDDKKTLHTVAFKLTYDVHGNVTAFDTVGIETGTWLDDTDINGSLELTGDPVDGGFAGVWHAYDRETDGLIDINGTYARTENTEVTEYIFNYTVEVDPANAENDDGKRSFTFVIGYDTGNFVPVYRIYTIPVRVALYASITSQQPYYLLQGGGYSDLVLTDPYGRQAVGQLLIYPNANIMTGTPLYALGSSGRDPQPQLFFTIMGEGENTRGILLDGTFASTNFGAFECDDTRELTVPVLKDDESGEYEDQTAVIDRIYFNGLGIAMLHRASDNTMLPAFYTRFSSSTYQLFQIVDGKPIAIAMFRLYTSTTEIPPEEEGGEPTTQTRYLVRFDDDGLRKLFNGAGSSVFITDGFGMATYVDQLGGLHTCTVSRLADHPEVVEVVYLDGLSLVRMYIEIEVEVKEDNTEECTFKILDSTDDRLPPPDSGEEGGGEGTQG